MHRRPLTYDEQKAADAAFGGKPFNSDWSDDARAVYVGIVDAMATWPAVTTGVFFASSARACVM